MAHRPRCDWTGESGKTYTYSIFELPVNFNPGQYGNYIFSRRNDDNLWVPIYIGQGDIMDRVENHHQAPCIKRKGATHVHAHLNSREADRLKEEKDLLSYYDNAYRPAGCNERQGG